MTAVSLNLGDYKKRIRGVRQIIVEDGQLILKRFLGRKVLPMPDKFHIKTHKNGNKRITIPALGGKE